MYLGLDCSSKAVHGIVIDEQENIVLQFKSEGKGSDFDTRFSQIFTDVRKFSQMFADFRKCSRIRRFYANSHSCFAYVH